MTEVDVKVERLVRLARVRNVDGILLTKQPNFAWMTGGQTNRIDGSVDIGAGGVFVTARGTRYVVASAIEMPRLRDEALHGLGFEPIDYPWTDDHGEPLASGAAIRRRLHVEQIGSDVSDPRVVELGRQVSALQAPLTDEELTRYRTLGSDVAKALENLCRSLRPGVTEIDVASAVNARIARLGARAVVTLVGADERIAQFRHPVPTELKWAHTLLVGLCAERHGLVVALSRLISVGPGRSELHERTAATAHVFARLLSATQPGTTGAELYDTAAAAYRESGHAREETRHHQGGAIGYRSRDWIAHPASTDCTHDRQAFAWNPSITGTKVEDTALLIDNEIELITATDEWPRIAANIRGRRFDAPGILEI